MSTEAKKWTSTAGPIQTNKVNKALSNLKSQHNMFTELTGVIGGEESSNTYYACYGTGGREDVAAVQSAIGEQFSWTVTRENYQEIIAAVAAALPELVKNIPVKDSRRTQEAVAIERAESMALAAERKAMEEAKHKAFNDAYVHPGEVAIPEGHISVDLVLCCDNSDYRSDYSDRHHSLGRPLALAIVRKQSETERLARQAVSRYPELAAVEFEWHTEKYSMGHGNYLESKGFELPPAVAEAYGKTHAHWEIQFHAWRGDKTVRAYKGYPGQQPQYQESAPSAGASANGVSVRYNAQHNGVEIAFDEKPSREVIDRCKAAGFRWSMRSKVWYKKLGAYTWAQAHTIAGIEPAPPMPNGKQSSGPDNFDMAVEDRMCEAAGINQFGQPE